MFPGLGIAVLLYVLYALGKGEVYAKDRWSGRKVMRTESPGYFWVVISIYAGLGIALLTIF
jgi:hypothetical protein